VDRAPVVPMPSCTAESAIPEVYLFQYTLVVRLKGPLGWVATLHRFATELGINPYNLSYTHDYSGFTRFVANREVEDFLRA